MKIEDIKPYGYVCEIEPDEFFDSKSEFYDLHYEEDSPCEPFPLYSEYQLEEYGNIRFEGGANKQFDEFEIAGNLIAKFEKQNKIMREALEEILNDANIGKFMRDGLLAENALERIENDNI